MQTIRAALVATLALVTLLLTAPAAHADNWGDTNCEQAPNSAACEVVVTYTGGDNTTSGGNGTIVCRVAGEVVDCHNAWGWLGSGGCYYGKDGYNHLPDHYYIKTCYDPATGDWRTLGTVYLAQTPSALAAITRRATDRLALPTPAIATSPDLNTPQIVHLPTWLWIEPGWWTARTATASVPGITITARAEPVTITWHTGDGKTVICANAGTAWTAVSAPDAKSPTCGHTYTSTSEAAPGGIFTLSAVATWRISWSGAGMSGTEPSLITTTAAGIRVTEVRALIRA
ncbi:hypothetical protein [Catellatospora chokoriensis]|uniref:ATP/GTP-binding protein n=1 Tax=Catellatospora chokoriensis TaxID=310353 RepID=A0A8J3K5D2_9ACTN|nr:hypothetical protein [Catellatospora chokoriensis]GIF89779.1 hypothetical protein Cch02nite_32230 [Catellatospora chokoriensis]